MMNAGFSAGFSVLLDWIPIVGIVIMIPVFLVRRHRYRTEKHRLEQIIASYEAARNNKVNSDEEKNMPAK